MKRNWVARIVKVAVAAAVAISVLGFIVMSLWNWLLVDLFGWRQIGFWQAFGLLVLSRILFGGFHGRGSRLHWRHRMMERWEKMTPEEREKFRQGMRCGHSPAPGEGTPV